jgi:hypothetical protein
MASTPGRIKHDEPHGGGVAVRLNWLRACPGGHVPQSFHLQLAARGANRDEGPGISARGGSAATSLPVPPGSAGGGCPPSTASALVRASRGELEYRMAVRFGGEVCCG